MVRSDTLEMDAELVVEGDVELPVESDAVLVEVFGVE